MGSFFVVSAIYNGKIIDIIALSQHPKYSSIKNKVIFENKRLKDVLLSLCSKLKLTLNFDVTLESELVDYCLQNNTDLFVINELAEIYGAVANILSFFLKNKLQKIFDYDEQEIISLASLQSSYKVYNGCKLEMWDFKQAKSEKFSIGDEPYLEINRFILVIYLKN